MVLKATIFMASSGSQNWKISRFGEGMPRAWSSLPTFWRPTSFMLSSAALDIMASEAASQVTPSARAILITV